MSKSATLLALHSSASVEWYTPPGYVQAARTLMGEIDLDPASCAEANRLVQAATFYTRQQDGYTRPWWGRVWLNPPYGRATNGASNQQRWSHRLLVAFTDGQVAEAVLLVTAATGTRWFQPFYRYPVCLCDHRIRFLSGSGDTRAGQPTQENAFVYLGPTAKYERFVDLFSPFGPIGRFERRDHAKR